MSDAAGLAGTTSPETGGRVRSYLISGWRFARHLLEMVVAMLAGMALLGVALAALGEPPGYANLLVEYGLMGASMSTRILGVPYVEVVASRHRGEQDEFGYGHRV